MTERFYTILADFGEGTYIEQVYSVSVSEAINSWFDICPIELNNKPLSAYKSKELIASLENDPPSLLTGRQNVWYSLIEIDDNFLHLNIVETVPLTGASSTSLG